MFLPAQLVVNVIFFWTRLMPSIGAHGFSLAKGAVLAADHQAQPARFHSKPDGNSTRLGQPLPCLAKPCKPAQAEIQQPLLLSCPSPLVSYWRRSFSCIILIQSSHPQSVAATSCYTIYWLKEVWVIHLCTFSSNTCRLPSYCSLPSSSPDFAPVHSTSPCSACVHGLYSSRQLSAGPSPVSPLPFKLGGPGLDAACQGNLINAEQRGMRAFLSLVATLLQQQPSAWFAGIVIHWLILHCNPWVVIFVPVFCY